VRILTFNHHEAYIATLAEVGHSFDIVDRKGALSLAWNERVRQLPANAKLRPFDAALVRDLRAGVYDVVICHTIKNLLWLFPLQAKRFVFVAHIPLFARTTVERLKSAAKKLIYKAFAATHHTKFVAVSQFKRDSWNVDGAVIKLAPKAFGDASYEPPFRVVTVGNQIKERGVEMGYPLLAEVMAAVPVLVVGDNPEIPGGTKPKNPAEFANILRTGSIYLYTIEQPHGDGYNTAMLEAMELGMAVVTVANATSPIRHGQNGLVGANAAELATHLKSLLVDPKRVRELGLAARDSVRREFSAGAFLAGWRAILEG
jgi:glycosyltransferase involved in cell wall biosynthesis